MSSEFYINLVKFTLYAFSFVYKNTFNKSGVRVQIQPFFPQEDAYLDIIFTLARNKDKKNPHCQYCQCQWVSQPWNI